MSTTVSANIQQSQLQQLQEESSKDAGLYEWQNMGVLGKGGSSTVFKGKLTRSGSFVAVKQIETECLNKSQINAIQSEIDTIKSLSHTNVLSYLGTQQQPHKVLIFLEYADGGSLRQYYQRRGPMNEQQIVYATHRILLGLQYLHSKGIAHRDVKCANCLLTTAGAVKLADFGASKRYESDSVVSGLKGTPHWMAPEVIKGTQMTTGWMKADVWSIGCTVVEMFTGKVPYANYDNPMTAMYKIASGELPSLSNRYNAAAEVLVAVTTSEVGEEINQQPIDKTLPTAALSAFVLACCAIDPTDRPAVQQLLELAFVGNHRSVDDASVFAVRESIKETTSATAVSPRRAILISTTATAVADDVRTIAAGSAAARLRNESFSSGNSDTDDADDETTVANLAPEKDTFSGSLESAEYTDSEIENDIVTNADVSLTTVASAVALAATVTTTAAAAVAASSTAADGIASVSPPEADESELPTPCVFKATSAATRHSYNGSLKSSNHRSSAERMRQFSTESLAATPSNQSATAVTAAAFDAHKGSRSLLAVSPTPQQQQKQQQQNQSLMVEVVPVGIVESAVACDSQEESSPPSFDEAAATYEAMMMKYSPRPPLKRNQDTAANASFNRRSDIETALSVPKQQQINAAVENSSSNSTKEPQLNAPKLAATPQELISFDFPEPDPVIRTDFRNSAASKATTPSPSTQSQPSQSQLSQQQQSQRSQESVTMVAALDRVERPYAPLSGEKLRFSTEDSSDKLQKLSSLGGAAVRKIAAEELQNSLLELNRQGKRRMKAGKISSNNSSSVGVRGAAKRGRPRLASLHIQQQQLQLQPHITSSSGNSTQHQLQVLSIAQKQEALLALTNGRALLEPNGNRSQSAGVYLGSEGGGSYVSAAAKVGGVDGRNKLPPVLSPTPLSLKKGIAASASTVSLHSQQAIATAASTAAAASAEAGQSRYIYSAPSVTRSVNLPPIVGSSHRAVRSTTTTATDTSSASPGSDNSPTAAAASVGQILTSMTPNSRTIQRRDNSNSSNNKHTVATSKLLQQSFVATTVSHQHDHSSDNKVKS